MNNRHRHLPRHDPGVLDLPFTPGPATEEPGTTRPRPQLPNDVDPKSKHHRQGFPIAVLEEDGAYYAGVVLKGGSRPRHPSPPTQRFDSALTIETPTGLRIEGIPLRGAHMAPETFVRWEKQYRQVVANRHQARLWSEQRSRTDTIHPRLPPPAETGIGYLAVDGIDHRGAVIIGAPVTETGWVESHAGVRGVVADVELAVAYRTYQRNGGTIRYGCDFTTILYGHAYVASPEEWVASFGPSWTVNSTEPLMRLPRVNPESLGDLGALERSVAARLPAAPTFAVVPNSSERSPDRPDDGVGR